ncbi:hypothetical protein DSO57_1011142 [Entomophthora muscae]|uniref:Uncharacterized protein n=1 Tax=Entomophthora muscae TaxID=34485 RepID=A0ACC2SVF6_9FUNG|nr:hypothetical protein DSO57_1011142 [Entomophthora muscae]
MAHKPTFSTNSYLRNIVCAPPSARNKAFKSNCGNKHVADTVLPRRKKVMNPFILFRSTNCRKLKETNPSFTNSDISRVLGNQWKHMSPSQKEPYIQRARALQTCEELRYKQENQNYLKHCFRQVKFLKPETFQPPKPSKQIQPSDIPPKVETTIIPLPPSLAKNTSSFYHQPIADFFFEEYDQLRAKIKHQLKTPRLNPF